MSHNRPNKIFLAATLFWAIPFISTGSCVNLCLFLPLNLFPSSYLAILSSSSSWVKNLLSHDYPHFLGGILTLWYMFKRFTDKILCRKFNWADHLGLIILCSGGAYSRWLAYNIFKQQKSELLVLPHLTNAQPRLGGLAWLNRQFFKFKKTSLACLF